MQPYLILYTADFPYGKGETFLETEIGYLGQAFEKVFIVSCNTTDAQTREVPQNCTLIRQNFDLSAPQKLRALGGRLSNLYKNEVNIIRDLYTLPLTQGIKNTLLVSLYKSKLIADFTESLIGTYPPTQKWILYSYWSDDAALGIARLRKNNEQIRAISRMHRWDVYFDQSMVNYLPLRSFLYTHLDKIFSISEDAITYAQKVWKVPVDKMIYSPLGIAEVTPGKTERNNPFTILSCSNMIGVKRVDLIAQAIGKIRKEEIKWIHLGDGPERTNIEKIIASYPPHIHAELKGHVTNTEVKKIYAEIQPDLFINMSSSEGVPVSIMEAMSFGIPVLATDVGGNKEIVNHRNGQLLPVNSTPEIISDAIQSFILKSDTDYALMRESAYATWKEKYHAQKNYSSFCNELKKLFAS